MSNDASNTDNSGTDPVPTGNPDNVTNRATESDPSEVNEIEASGEASTGLSSRIRNFTDRYVRSGIQPKQVTSELFEDIEDAVADGGGRLLRVDPYPENESVEAAESLFQELHDARMKWFNLVNASETHGFEIWFNDGKLSFYFYVRSERAEKKFKKQIDAYYPNAKIVPIHGNPRRSVSEFENSSASSESDEEDRTSRSQSWWDERFPPIYDGDYVAAAQLKKKHSHYYPLRSTKGIIQMKEDPYKAITSEVLSDDLDRTMIQVVFKPADPHWSDGKPGSNVIPMLSNSSDVAKHLQSEKLEDEITTSMRGPTQEERQLSEKVMEFSRRNAYHTNVRVVSFSPYENEAKQNVWSISTALERSYEETAGEGDTQTFEMVPGAGNKINELVLQSARREWKDCGTILTVPELAGVAHIPNETIETPAVTWNQTGKGARPPADMPRFDEPPERLPPGVRFKQNKTEATDGEVESEDLDETPEHSEPNTDDGERVEPPDTDESQQADSEPDSAQNNTETDTDSTDATDTPNTTNTPDEGSDTESSPEGGIIGSAFPADTDGTDATELTDTETTDNNTGAEAEEEDSTTTIDTPTSSDTDTTEREDPEPTQSDSAASNGYNKSISFGDTTDDETNDETDEETHS